MGVLPVACIGFVRSAYARDWAMRETAKALHDQGISAHFDVLLHLWPLSIELANVRIDSWMVEAPRSPRAVRRCARDFSR